MLNINVKIYLSTKRYSGVEGMRVQSCNDCQTVHRLIINNISNKKLLHSFFFLAYCYAIFRYIIRLIYFYFKPHKILNCIIKSLFV